MGFSGTGAVNLFARNGAREPSPRNSLGQRGSIVSTLSGTLRKPSGSTLISLAGMLADREASASAAAGIAGPSLTTPMGSGTLNSSALSVRERRSSRCVDSQERDTRLRRSMQQSENTSTKTTRQTSLSNRNTEEERRAVHDQSSARRRERNRYEEAQYHCESEPFMGNRIRIDQWVKVNTCQQKIS